jgi:two-component system CheB/CheR fusion protein
MAFMDDNPALTPRTIDQLLLENEELRRKLQEAERMSREKAERLQDELRQRAKALAESERHKNEFLAMLAHELRNPLAPILNAIHVMQVRGTPDPYLQWSRDVVLRQAQQLSRLVDDLLDVSRITRGKVQLRLQSVELPAVIQRAVETSRPHIDAKGHHLTVTLPAEMIRLHADSARLAQVFANLLNNAAKYMEPGGQIWLSAQREGNQVAVHVRDTGVGITQDMLPKIFDVFTQADRALDRSHGGLGIGLNLVQNLVQMHGGTVAAFSAGPGQGSEFVVRLPCLPEAPPQKDESPAAQPQFNCPGLRVLVVDDNVDSAQVLVMLLASVGQDATAATDGQTALAAAKAQKPDVILLDIGLPGMDGFEVCRRLRQQEEFKQTMVAALTGYAHEEDRRKSQEAGFDVHLVKPVALQQLQELLARAASRKQ